MRVRVRFHRDSSEGLARWMRMLLHFENRRIYHQTMVGEIKNRLTMTKGAIPEALMVEKEGIVSFWWPFLPNVWVRYRRRDRGWFLWKLRDIIVVEILDHPPIPEV